MTPDPPVLSPTCPRCGAEPLDPIFPLHRQALCPTEDCRVLMWDPCNSAEEFERTARTIDLPEELGTSGGVPITDELVERLAGEAEAGYDPEQLRPAPRVDEAPPPLDAAARADIAARFAEWWDRFELPMVIAESEMRSRLAELVVPLVDKYGPAALDEIRLITESRR